MKISQMIAALTDIMEQEGDLRVTICDENALNGKWDPKNEDMWLDGTPFIDFVTNDEGDAIETVVTIGA